MDKSRVESTIFFIEKISFSLKIFSGHFYGQSFIKTVRGPYTFAIVYKGRQTKETSVIDEPAHVEVRLQLLEMSSITTPNQTISNVCKRYNILRALF